MRVLSLLLEILLGAVFIGLLVAAGTVALAAVLAALAFFAIVLGAFGVWMGLRYAYCWVRYPREELQLSVAEVRRMRRGHVAWVTVDGCRLQIPGDGLSEGATVTVVRRGPAISCRSLRGTAWIWADRCN